jgi:hypothetical protein
MKMWSWSTFVHMPRSEAAFAFGEKQNDRDKTHVFIIVN